MTRRCIIEGCNSKSGNPQHRGVTFHSFPFDSKTREVWLLNCRINPEKNITKSVLVCSRHFRRADFQPVKSNKYLLKQGSVPTIFPWGKIAYLERDAAAAEAISDDPVVMQTERQPIPFVEGTDDVLDMEIATIEKTALKRPSQDSIALQDPKIPKLSTSAGSSISQQDIQNLVPISTMPAVPGCRKSETVSGFVPGVRLEAQDFDGVWHSARVIEVDNDEREVLIRFEKSGKSKGLSGAEEWITMNSSRLRQKAASSTKSSNVFVLGEKCLARWSGARRFPATIHQVLANDSYEILFDDGYMKVLKSAHISKMKIPVGKTQSPAARRSPIAKKSSTPVKQKYQLPKKDWPLISMSSLNLDELNLPDIPKDGEWCCHWVNDQPIGREGFLTVGDHKKPTVVVDDWRLPSGWTKHMYQRSNVLGKWDVILVNSNSKRFRSKADLKQYIEDLGQHYNPDIYDFSIHRRRAKDIGAYVFTKDYKAPVPPKPAPVDPPPLIQPLTAIQNVNQIVTEQTTPETTGFIESIAGKALDGEYPALEDGYVYVGSLKVQIIDNLFRCPKDGCNKNFRKENHLQIHIKHYHDDIAKFLGDCPNMQELACKRTIGNPSEEPLPKNHLSNAQFFAKLHQQDLQTKLHRKSISAPMTPPIISTPPHHGIGDSSLVLNTIVEDATRILDSPEISSVAAICTVPENSAVTNSSVFMHSTGDGISSTIPAAEAPKAQPTKSGRKSAGDRKSTRQRLQKKYLNSHSSRLFDTSFHLNDYEETRHSFNGTPENKLTKKAKLMHPTFVQDSNIDGNTTGSAPEQTQSQSPKYIQENGEVIKIVRMRSEEIINCLCSFGEEDGLMIQCELCLCWQHGICNGIEKESQVPEKYVCYICKNPLLGRASMKYIHDQDWLYEGKLQTGSYHTQNPKLAERFSTLRNSHTLSGNLIELKRFLHSLRVKINIAENKDHPKMYLWAKTWESSSPNALKDIKNEKIESPIVSNEIPSSKQDVKNETTAVEESQYESKIEKDCYESDNKNEESNVEEKPTESLENIKEVLPIQPKQKSPPKFKQNFNYNQPTIPQPEAAIDPVECQHRLLEHIQKQQTCVIDRLHDIESQIVELESANPCTDFDTADYTKTKQTLSILINDLEVMRKIAKINAVSPSYVAFT